MKDLRRERRRLVNLGLSRVLLQSLTVHPPPLGPAARRIVACDWRPDEFTPLYHSLDRGELSCHSVILTKVFDKEHTDDQASKWTNAVLSSGLRYSGLQAVFDS